MIFRSKSAVSRRNIRKIWWSSRRRSPRSSTKNRPHKDLSGLLIAVINRLTTNRFKVDEARSKWQLFSRLALRFHQTKIWKRAMIKTTEVGLSRIKTTQILQTWAIQRARVPIFTSRNQTNLTWTTISLTMFPLAGQATRPTWEWMVVSQAHPGIWMAPKETSKAYKGSRLS
jgi:hypothetical protein